MLALGTSAFSGVECSPPSDNYRRSSAALTRPQVVLGGPLDVWSMRSGATCLPGRAKPLADRLKWNTPALIGKVRQALVEKVARQKQSSR